MSAEAIALWTDTSSDPELIAGVRAGDPAAFGVLYERHVDAARKVASQYTNSASDVDDVVSESFSRVLRALQRGDGPDLAFRAYLFTIVRRTGLDVIDKGNRTRPREDMGHYEEALGYEAASDEPALAGFEHSMVADAYKSLPERWQAVLWYTEIEKKSPKEVAPLLGLTANGVAALAYRAREALRQAYLQQHLSTSVEVSCMEANTQLGSYVRGGLSKREHTRIDAHVRDCERCTALVLELEDVNRGLRGIIAPLFMGSLGVGALQGGMPVGGVYGPGGAAGGAGAGSASTAGGVGAGGTSAGAASAASTGFLGGLGGLGALGAAGIFTKLALPAAAAVGAVVLAVNGANLLGGLLPTGGGSDDDVPGGPLVLEDAQPATRTGADSTANLPADTEAALPGDLGEAEAPGGIGGATVGARELGGDGETTPVARAHHAPGAALDGAPTTVIPAVTAPDVPPGASEGPTAGGSTPTSPSTPSSPSIPSTPSTGSGAGTGTDPDDSPDGSTDAPDTATPPGDTSGQPGAGDGTGTDTGTDPDPAPDPDPGTGSGTDTGGSTGGTGGTSRLSIAKAPLEYLAISRTAPVVTLGLTNLGDAEVSEVTASIALPQGLTFATTGGGAGSSALREAPLAARMSATTGVTFDIDDWTCALSADSRVVTCELETVGAGGDATLAIDVTLLADRLADDATTTFTVDAGDQHLTYTVATGIDDSDDEVDTGYTGAGKLAVRQFGAPLMSCDTRFPGCTAARQSAFTGGTGQFASDNNDYRMVPLNETGGRHSSSATSVALPAGAVVTSATLEWSANRGAFDDWTGSLDQARLRAPGGSYADITADEVDTVADGLWRYYLARADVTELVAATGAGAYALADIATADPLLGWGTNLYAGFTLTIVYEDPSLTKESTVTLLEGPHWVSKDSPVVREVSLPQASDVTLGWTAYETDRSLTGDRIAFDGDAFTPVRQTGNGASENAGDSHAYGAAYANTFGTDAKPFATKPSRPAGLHRLEVTSDGDDFLIGTIAVTIAH